ncbi:MULTISPECIES: hypothetical protein [Actinomycetes]|uniref:hypothetical protein n=1 Tax=Actinomycetes TaxID=1760 RepID=UPI003646D875
MARSTTRIGSTDYTTEGGRTTATNAHGTVELTNGQTYADPDTGAHITPRGDSLHITGNVNGGLSGDFR